MWNFPSWWQPPLKKVPSMIFPNITRKAHFFFWPKNWTEGQALGHRGVRHRSGTCIPSSRCCSELQLPPLLFRLSADVPWEAAGDGTCHPCGKLRWNLGLLALAWPSPSCYGHLGMNQQVEDLSLFLCSAFQVDEKKHFFKGLDWEAVIEQVIFRAEHVFPEGAQDNLLGARRKYMEPSKSSWKIL